MKTVNESYVSHTKTPLYLVQDTNILLGTTEKTSQKRYDLILSKLISIEKKYTDIMCFTEAYEDTVERDEYCLTEAYFFTNFTIESENEKLLIKVLKEFMLYCKNVVKVKFANAEVVTRLKTYSI